MSDNQKRFLVKYFFGRQRMISQSCCVISLFTVRLKKKREGCDD